MAICLPPIAVIALNLRAQSPAARRATASTSSASRKSAVGSKNKRMVAYRGIPGERSARPAQRIVVSPAAVDLLPGATQRFTVSDGQGRNVTSEAQWSLSNTYVAELAPSGGPAIVAKEPGDVTVRAIVDGEQSSSKVRVSEGRNLPAGMNRWRGPTVPRDSAGLFLPGTP